jgi:hypothetical protein
MPGGIAKWLRQRSAKPLFTSSNLVAASTFNNFKELAEMVDSFFFFWDLNDSQSIPPEPG